MQAGIHTGGVIRGGVNMLALMMRVQSSIYDVFAGRGTGVQGRGGREKGGKVISRLPGGLGCDALRLGCVVLGPSEVGIFGVPEGFAV